MRRLPVLIGGNGPRRTLPLAARYADEWNGVFITPEVFAERSARLDELAEQAGRAPGAIKRSLMTPLVKAGAELADQLDAYARVGCQRVMLQITEYDDLSPVEACARDVLPRFAA